MTTHMSFLRLTTSLSIPPSLPPLSLSPPITWPESTSTRRFMAIVSSICSTSKGLNDLLGLVYSAGLGIKPQRPLAENLPKLSCGGKQ